jgi:hypothetical protein
VRDHGNVHRHVHEAVTLAICPLREGEDRCFADSLADFAGRRVRIVLVAVNIDVADERKTFFRVEFGCEQTP